MPPSPKADVATAKSAGKSDATDTPAVAAPLPAPPAKGVKVWLPVLAALILAPAATWATIEYALVPYLTKRIAASATPAPAVQAPVKGKDGHDPKDGGPSYEFQNVVVNLAGTMGTRYLKTSFIVTGADGNIKALFDGSKPKLTDVTLNVLSSLTLSDLEEPGAKNVIREKLVIAYNQALGRRVADQVYFSDFVIQ